MGIPTVAAVGAGRAEAARGWNLEAVYLESAAGLWRALYGFTGGRRHLAEDAVAEAFARAAEHADGIRAPVPWIYRTAFRIATRELKRERRQPPPAPDPVPGIEPSSVEEILRAVATLSANQRAAVLLHDLEGFGAAEVAAMLGIAAPTVRVHLYRARKRLRTLLGTEEERDD